MSADFDTDLTRRLAALDEATAQVHLRGADAVRRRGRQRARRQTAGAVVATLAVVGIGVAVVTGLGDRAAEPVPVGPVPSVTLEPTPDGAAPAPPEVDPDPTGAWLQASDLPTDPYGQWTAEAEGDFIWDQAPPSPTWDNFPCAPTGEGLDVDVPVEADAVGAAARRFSVDGHQLTQYVLEYPDGNAAERAWDRHVDQAGAPCQAVLSERATSDVEEVEASSTPFSGIGSPSTARSLTSAARFLYPGSLSEEGFVILQQGRLLGFVTVRPVDAPLDAQFAGEVFRAAGERLREASEAS